ncbi:MAG: mechanosensitive ion channel [Deltaproteobacteria bacterium]|nr:mechanosensitive ion channel [Deltaproteobacteria bacterium]
MTWIEDQFERFSTWAETSIPAAVLAVVIVLLGYLIALLLKHLATRLLRRWSTGLVGVVERISHQRGVPIPIERAETETVVVKVTSRIVFWLVFVIFIAAATSVVGFPVVSTWLQGFAAYLPRVLAALAVVLLGILAGNLARVLVLSAAASAGLSYARTLARTIHISIILIAAVIAIEELGVQVTFLIVLGSIALGAVLGGAALAFGLGARGAVSNLVACHYLVRSYRVGHRIRIDGFEGAIVAIEPTAVVLQTAEGRVSIPARTFSEKPSTLLSGETTS